MLTTLRGAALSAVLLTFGSAYAQAPATTPEAQAKPGAQATPPAPPKPGPKPYAEIVTKDAVSQEGLFRVHRIDDKILWEIPTKLHGREMLWQTEVAQVGMDSNGYPGTAAGTQIVRFERRGDKVYLKLVEHSMRAASDDEVKIGVAANSVDPIIAAYPVLAEGKDKSAVVDVSSLFTSDPQDFSVKSVVGGNGVDANRSYVDKIKAYPENIETTSTLTFNKSSRTINFGSFVYTIPGNSSTTAVVRYSLVALPEKPMMGRLKDSRIGYFTQAFTEYGRAENRAMAREYIDRFRLEKKDPGAALSEPVKPIVFYLAREVPSKWRAAMKKGVEQWNVAFEQAGFKNAILCKDAPSLKDDPDWDAEDARYSVIRWAPSTTANAMGPSVQDPRSGETISAHIIVWHNILDLVQNWYFVQAAAIDPKAAKLPLSDALTADLVEYVVAHEVGHTLGLEHNMKASSAYTVAQLRDPKFTAENGVSPSIMDYSRFNYVAQPGDGVTRTISAVGPYDRFAIEYGYKPYPTARTPDDEKPQLDSILARQVGDPRLRFGNYKYYEDPSTQTEDIGSDAVEAGRLGLMNIDRIAKNTLFDATTKFGEDYERLATIRYELINQRMLELFHVAGMIGGVVETDYHYGRGGDAFKPVPADRQRAAVAFLLDKGMHVPKALFDPRILNKIEPDGIVGEATGLSSGLIGYLLSPDRVSRLLDNEALNGSSAYKVTDLVHDLTSGVWDEVGTPRPAIDVYRRSLQRDYLSTMDRKVNDRSASTSELRPIVGMELRSLAKRIDLALPRTSEGLTRAHLLSSRRDIENILNNKYSPPSSGSGMGSGFIMMGAKAKPGALDCWTNHADLSMRSFEPRKPEAPTKAGPRKEDAAGGQGGTFFKLR